MNETQYEELREEDRRDCYGYEYNKCNGNDNCETCPRFADDCDGWKNENI